jgi:hypothetical protein
MLLRNKHCVYILPCHKKIEMKSTVDCLTQFVITISYCRKKRASDWLLCMEIGLIFLFVLLFISLRALPTEWPAHATMLSYRRLIIHENIFKELLIIEPCEESLYSMLALTSITFYDILLNLLEREWEKKLIHPQNECWVSSLVIMRDGLAQSESEREL